MHNGALAKKCEVSPASTRMKRLLQCEFG